VLGGHWEELYDEVKAMRAACKHAHLKTILATGELASLDNVYKASMVCMMAGADVIKVRLASSWRPAAGAPFSYTTNPSTHVLS
jgi:deoxyribose-phosphate aldolase